MLRTSSGLRAVLPPACTGASVKPIRLSSSMSNDASLGRGSSATSSLRSVSASAGMDSADSGGMISSPPSDSRMGPAPLASVTFETLLQG